MRLGSFWDIMKRESSGLSSDVSNLIKGKQNVRYRKKYQMFTTLTTHNVFITM